MDIKCFRDKRTFSQKEIIAFSKGELIEDYSLKHRIVPFGKLLMFDKIQIIEWDGEKGKISAEKANFIDDWFYEFHFKGDPVMPGCFGASAVWQALKFFAFWVNLPDCIHTTSAERIIFSDQIRPYDKCIRYELDVNLENSQNDNNSLNGSARVYIDNQHIYTLEDFKIGSALQKADEDVIEYYPDNFKEVSQSDFKIKLTYNEFKKRTYFNYPELIAFSHHNLVKDEPVEFPALPSGDMLMPHKIHLMNWDEEEEEGEIIASRTNSFKDWFYNIDSLKNPILPPELCVDTIWQLIGFYGTWLGADGVGRALRANEITFYDYIKPSDKEIVFNIKIENAGKIGNGTLITGDGYIFADKRPIMKMENGMVGIYTGLIYSDYPLPSKLSKCLKTK